MPTLPRAVNTLILLAMLLGAAAVVSAANNAQSDPSRHETYRGLAALLDKRMPADDYVALSDYDDAYETSVHQASIEYLNENPQLVERICHDLGGDDIHWELEGVSHRLMYAPENRLAISRQFTSYCRDAIADVLDRTGLPNPYSSIVPLTGSPPKETPGSGIEAYIVNDLAREYEARYMFSGPAKRKVEIDLSGRIQINEVGSYASYLHFSDAHHRWEFTRDRHTIWKCSSSNPYTVLMTPLEETLHIELRGSTERAIRTAVEAIPGQPSIDAVEQIAEAWLAVEEAVVGGLVYALAPEVVIKRVPDLSTTCIQDDLETKSKFKKYRLLRSGIAWVAETGIRESIDRYKADPAGVRAVLTEATVAARR